ncbi:uncharacterized protein METZ01_LOCUS132632, partial [marine metagenome]
KNFPKNKVNLGGINSVGIAIKNTKTIPVYKKRLNSSDLISNI